MLTSSCEEWWGPISPSVSSVPSWHSRVIQPSICPHVTPSGQLVQADYGGDSDDWKLSTEHRDSWRSFQSISESSSGDSVYLVAILDSFSWTSDSFPVFILDAPQSLESSFFFCSNGPRDTLRTKHVSKVWKIPSLSFSREFSWKFHSQLTVVRMFCSDESLFPFRAFLLIEHSKEQCLFIDSNFSSPTQIPIKRSIEPFNTLHGNFTADQYPHKLCHPNKPIVPLTPPRNASF